jgi:hypothetical protein
MNLSITDNGPSLHFLWTKDSNVPSFWSFFIMYHQVLPDHTFGNDWVKTTSDHEVNENTFTFTLSKSRLVPDSLGPVIFAIALGHVYPATNEVLYIPSKEG